LIIVGYELVIELFVVGSIIRHWY